MFFKKIFLSVHLGFLSVYFSLVSCVASFTKNRKNLQRTKMLVGIAIISISSTLSGCFVKPKHTCYSPVPADTTRYMKCYERTVPADTSKNKSENPPPKDLIKEQNQDKNPPPMCYKKSK